MKYCKNCGSEIEDEAVVCVHCGCATETQAQPAKKRNFFDFETYCQNFYGSRLYSYRLVPYTALLDYSDDGSLFQCNQKQSARRHRLQNLLVAFRKLNRRSCNAL